MHILISYIFVSFGKLSFFNVFIHFTECIYQQTLGQIFAYHSFNIADSVVMSLYHFLYRSFFLNQFFWGFNFINNFKG